jgi:hypothetical protein
MELAAAPPGEGSPEGVAHGAAAVSQALRAAAAAAGCNRAAPTAVALAAAPAPLARRALRRWLSDPYPPDLATLERIMAVVRGETLACDIGENREIRRSKQRLILQLLG